MKHAIYFEDMFCNEFVVHMGQDGVGEFLEQRVWNDDVDCGGDQFSSYRKKDDRTRAELYEWIDAKSKIVAIALPTERWTDREWKRLDSMETKAIRASLKWAVEQSRNRRKKGDL